jgi:putative RNA 2'-phosphotransferase
MVRSSIDFHNPTVQSGEMANSKSVSKYLSLVLRHQPHVAGLTLDENGWVGVEDVLNALRAKYGDMKLADLQEVVDTNDKKRFVIVDGRIRANQGHSVEVDLALEPTVPPTHLYHGTKIKVLEAISKQGLIPGSRQHVHLSETIDTAKVVANRRAGSSVILRIDTTNMKQPFFVSENGVWLTEHVPPEFIFEEDYPD